MGRRRQSTVSWSSWPRPRRWPAILAGALLPLVATPPAEATPDSTGVRISASNFRFCLEAPCRTTDQAYVRTDSGALVDNAAAFIDVRPGDEVIWTYEDDRCDALVAGPLLTCPGHQVQFETGQPSARGTLGMMPARQGPSSLTWRVPTDAEAGTLIRYYCDLSDHWRLGVTGVLAVTG